ncbi:MAG TPA: hypothetical protein VM677_06995, partial [Actinokineospora sp.]|nr:hypothetical protein [Actinokineospora sp.]
IPAAYLAAREVATLTLTAFPYALLPNPLVRELRTLTGAAGIRVPLVDEVAADIFMGTFTTKWRDAAALASRTMAGTLYARYYDLPRDWNPRRRSPLRWGRETAQDFADLCARRSAEAGSGGGHVARNGTVLEQSQILTTHNLAALITALDLTDSVTERAPDLAAETFNWTVRKLARPAPDWYSALIQVKNAAYAWRQAIFLLSFCPPRAVADQVDRLRAEVAEAGLTRRFGPAVEGLAHIAAGGGFNDDGTTRVGRRFLGWAAGEHWYLTASSAPRR